MIKELPTISEKKTRKFKDKAYFKNDAKGRYYLLPFRFKRLNNRKEILVNELGEYMVVASGIAERIITKDLCRDNDAVLYDDLQSSFFISEQPIPSLSKVFEARYRTKKSFLDGFTSLHIFVITLRCEHTCHYCQVSRVTENKTAFDMSKPNIDLGIDLMMQSPNDHVTMEFQGGEALLAFENIQYAVLRAEQEALKKGKTITFVICTNLTPITEDILHFCKDHNILISTSLDGPQYIHNKNRHKPGGDSYQKTIEGIELSRKIIGDENISALLTTTNLSLQHPVEIVDEYVQRGFSNIFLRPISPYGFAKHNAKKNHYDMDRFLEFYKKAFSRIVDYNRNGYFIREDYATVILKKILTPFPVGYVDLQSPSGIICNAIVFNYDGKVYASDEARMLAEMGDSTFQLGTLDQSYEALFYGEKTLGFSEAMVNESLAGCSECAFQPYCGADPVLHYATQGDMYGYRPTSIFCHKNMEIIEYLFHLMEENDDIEKIFRSWISGHTL